MSLLLLLRSQTVGTGTQAFVLPHGIALASLAGSGASKATLTSPGGGFAVTSPTGSLVVVADDGQREAVVN